MIDVTEYLDKLKVLKKYMGHVIDNGDRILILNLDAIPIQSGLDLQVLLTIWRQTGCLVYNGRPEEPTTSIATFEEYYNLSKTN